MQPNRRNLLVASAAAPLALTSCAQGGGIDPNLVAQVIAQVQQAVATACKAAGVVIPTATTILAMVEALGIPFVAGDTAVAVAQLLMNTLCPPPARAKVAEGQTVDVNGKKVVIEIIKV